MTRRVWRIEKDKRERGGARRRRLRRRAKRPARREVSQEKRRDSWVAALAASEG